MARTTGKYGGTIVGGEEVSAFIPHPLPPRNPPLVIEADLSDRLARAESALKQLELAGSVVPSLRWLIHSFVRKEAVVSSQIEGTQATLVDLLTYEAAGRSDADIADVEEVCNYIDALDFARSQLQRKKGLPLSMRLLNGTHRRLMTGIRGSTKKPGEVRTSQNWIGGTRPGNAVFVPPPPQHLPDLLSAFEKYIHADDDLPTLVRAGLLHVQFETIHPYLDGNGRIGRLLVTLLLEHYGLLTEPLLYLSLFFKRHQAEYYRRLGAVRTDGDFEGWTAFFVEGVESIATEAVETIKDLFAMVTDDREKVLASTSITVTGARLFELLPEHPIVTIARVVDLLETTKPTATKAVSALVDAGVLVETSGRRRDKTFSYAAYLYRLREGTELS